MEPLKTSGQVIDAAGGTGAFADWWGTNARRVSDWRKRGFPAETILVMSARLKDEKGITVAPSAWGVIDPASHRSPALSSITSEAV